MRSMSVTLALLLVVSGYTAAVADDIYPPAWRGQPGSTMQEWLFSNSIPDPIADINNNPYGNPIAHPRPGTGQEWVDEWGGRQGIWPLSGTILFDIPNTPVPNPYKEIWVQITWAKQVTSSTPGVVAFLPGGPDIASTLVREIPLAPTGALSPSDMWYHSTYKIRIEPNPAFEHVYITGTLLVDQVVIDTICVPEPATLAMLGLGGLVMIRRRKA